MQTWDNKPRKKKNKRKNINQTAAAYSFCLNCVLAYRVFILQAYGIKLG